MGIHTVFRAGQEHFEDKGGGDEEEEEEVQTRTDEDA